MLADIWDGEKLKNFSTFENNTISLAFSLSTDGVPVFKSSTVSMWPAYLLVLNLPVKVRMNSSNIILAGLWVGHTKPPMKLLLDPVISNLDHLRNEGFVITILGRNITITGQLVIAIFDLPAKAAVLCAKQFNGKHGCSVCLHPGKRLSNNARVYLPETHPDRTDDGVQAAATDAISTKTSVDGIMGKSPLTGVVDLVDSIPVDYMHACLEGVTKMLLNCWTSTNNHRQPFYLGRNVAELDKGLLKQQPPTEFTRPPRSIRQHLKYWKASELKYWLLFYSLPLLLQKLPSLFWHHYALFVCAMHILLKNSISVEEIAAAEEMLLDFCKLIPELYGEMYCSHNMHLLTHLCRYVRLWGPLWTHSLFGFENKNGHIKHLFHGNDDIHHQILHNIDASLTMQLMHHHLPDEVTKYTRRRNMSILGDHCYIVGSTAKTTLTNEQKDATETNQESNVVFFRLYKAGITYYSTSYVKEREFKRENTICCFTDREGTICYGQINLFVFDPTPVALIKMYHIESVSMMQSAGNPCKPRLRIHKEADFLSTIIKPVTFGPSTLTAVSIDDIVGKPVIVKVDRATYLINQPNVYEHH